MSIYWVSMRLKFHHWLFALISRVICWGGEREGSRSFHAQLSSQTDGQHQNTSIAHTHTHTHAHACTPSYSQLHVPLASSSKMARGTISFCQICRSDHAVRPFQSPSSVSPHHFNNTHSHAVHAVFKLEASHGGNSAPAISSSELARASSPKLHVKNIAISGPWSKRPRP